MSKYHSTWKGLVVETRRPNRLFTKAYYDATRGFLDSTRVHSPFGTVEVATTRYKWDLKYGFPVEVRTPYNTSGGFYIDSSSYDANTGNRLWMQRGGSAYRVTFQYTTDGLDSTVAEPGINKAVVLYDATRRNVRRTITPKGYHTIFYRDALGRATDVFTPIDTATASDSSKVVTRGQQVRTAYDLVDRVINTTKYGPVDTLPGFTIRRTASGSRTFTTKRATSPRRAASSWAEASRRPCSRIGYSMTSAA